MDMFLQYAHQLSVHTSTYGGKLALLMQLQIRSKYDVLSKLSIATTASLLYRLLNQEKITVVSAAQNLPNGDITCSVFF